MKALILVDKMILIGRFLIISALIALPLKVNAEYYLVYGPPDVPAVCDACASPRPYYRHVYKIHKVRAHHRYRYYHVVRRPSHYSITVYYPVPTYVQTPCTCCGGFMAPTYYWVPAPYQVYYTHPDDRLVGNRYEESYPDPSLDTGTADNDVY